MLALNQVKPSKEALGGYITDIVTNVEKGYDNTVEIAAKLDFIIKICEGAKKEIKDSVVKELAKDKDRKDYFGYKVEVCEAGTKYDYSNCGDAKWYELQEQLAHLQAQIKDREVFLKGIKEPLAVLNEETGEVFKVSPPVKTSTTTAKFTLK